MVEKVCLVDFDGTVELTDLSQLTVDHFASEEWVYYEQLYNEHKLSLEDTIIEEYSLIKGSKNTILEFIDPYYIIRNNFTEFVNYCQATNVPIHIVSGGIDFIIRHVLDETDISKTVEVIAMRTKYQEDGSIKIIRPKRLIQNSIDFKHGMVQYYKQMGCYVYYIGDGESDFTAVKDADLIFAVHSSELSDFCKGNNLQYVEFSDFKEIIDHLQKEKE